MQRAALLPLLLTACAAHGGVRLAAPERYEVGEEATISIDAPGADADSPLEGDLVLTSPDGTKTKQHVRLVHGKNRIKLGEGPTFMQTGRYRVELMQDQDHVLAAPIDIAVNIDRLTDLLSETIVDYKAKTRFAKPRAAGTLHWMQYAGVYEHPWQENHDIEVEIEEPHEAFKRAWSEYEEQGTLQVIQNSYVRLREGADTTMAAWTSSGLIIVLRSSDLAKLDMKFLSRFFAKYPSDLKAGRGGL